MKFTTGCYKNSDNVQLITDILDIVQVDNTTHDQYLEHLTKLENIILSNEFVQTLQSPNSDNVLIVISDKNPEKTLDTIIESNMDINTYLYPSDIIEECTDDIWYYYEDNIIILKYNLKVLNHIILLNDK